MAAKTNPTTGAFKLALKHVARGFLWDVLYFPVWLVTKGAKRIINTALDWIRSFARRFALLILAKSLFKPMYGQRDWQGRIISFFVRLFHLAGLTAIWIAWSALVIVVAFFWLVLPILIVWAFLYQIAVLPQPPLYWFF